MMMLRLFSFLFLFQLPLFAQLKQEEKWKGVLYCLATWAEKANPEEPKDLREAFLYGPHHQAKPIKGLSSPMLVIDSDDPETKELFGQGLAWLFGFAPSEAERAFRGVVTKSPECAMGYWGLALANFSSEKRARYFAQFAKSKLRPKTPPVVRQWIETLDAYFLSEKTPSERLAALAKDFDVLCREGQPGATPFLIRQLVLNGQGGSPVASPWVLDQYAEKIRHTPSGRLVAPYRWALWMNEDPVYLRSSKLLDAEVLPLPSVALLKGEAQLLTGEFEAAGLSFCSAFGLGDGFAQNYFTQPVEDTVRRTSLLRLATTLCRLGRVREALRIVKVAENLPRTFVEKKVGTDPIELARVQIQLASGLSLEETPLLKKCQEAWTGEKEPWSEEGLAECFLPEARARWYLEKQKPEQALEQLPENARRAFLPRALVMSALKAQKNSRQVLFLFDKEFRSQGTLADDDLSVFPALAEVAKLRALGEKWMLPPSAKARVLTGKISQMQISGARPPKIVLPDRHQKTINLESYQGKPVVVIFFLGAGCLYCVEQLHSFLPFADQYKEAGFEFLCVSTDPVSVLEKTIAVEKLGEKPMPFTIVSDQQLETFKQWKVYQEFENRPMHGTFVLNAKGEAVWSHIDNQPFMKPEWLLNEAKRLVGESKK